MHSSKTTIACLLSCLALAATAAHAQSPWTVSLTPTLNPLPLGMCGAVQLRIFDPATKDVPRNPQGLRITMADFDLSADGASVAGNQIDAYHFEVCGCPGGAPGGAAKVTATYPARAVAENARVRGIAVSIEAPFALAEPKGSAVPPACVALANRNARNGVSAGVASPVATPSATATARVPADPFAPAASNTPAAGRNPTAGGLAAAGMVNPANFTPYQTGPNTVILRWDPVGGVAYYGLFGPGLPEGGVKVSNATNYIATQVPPGGNEWALGSFYEPGPVSTPAANFSRARLNVTGPAVANNATGNTPPTGTPNSDPTVACQFASSVSSYAQTQAAVSGTNASSSTAASNCPPSASSPNSPAQSSPPGASGRYLVTVLGFRAYAVSADDPLSRDGFGDESYAAAYIRRYDRRTQQLVSATNCRTRTYGDVAVANSATLSNSCTGNTNPMQSTSAISNSQNEVNGGSSTFVSLPRIQGGTWMATGGIKDNDMIPNGPAVAARNQPPQDTAFPWRLWEGTLVDGVDALVITPSIWEQDSPVLTSGTVAEINQAMQQQSLAFYNQWRQQQQTLDSSILGNSIVQDQISGKRFGMVAAGAQANGTNSIGSAFFFNQLSMVATQGIPLGTLLGSSADRPIGLVSTGPDQTALPNRVVVLTREIIEAALAGPALGVIPSTIPNVAGVAAPVRGVIMVPFFDGRMPLSGQSFIFTERPAMYQMFIQVERAP